MTDQTGSEATTRHGVADDLTLLLFQPSSGTISGENTLFYVLAGAVLTDLAVSGAARADDRGARGTIVSAAGRTAPDDDILAEAWRYISEKPRSVQTVLAAIGPRLREPVLDRLVERGDLHRTRGKVLGFISTEKLRLGDTGRREQLMAEVRAVLVDGVKPSARIAALVALISASGALPTLHREIPWTSAVIARATELERGDFGADAAASAVTRTMTAVVVSSVVTASVIANR